MKKILPLILATLFFAEAEIFAYYQLMVGDPRNSWYWEQGTIEQAVLTVKPKGIFMEYGLYLTFSSNGTYYGPTDTLEVILNFDLPQEAKITDSWLWIGDEPVQAEILDKWTASLVYEGIVKRRRDPSILTQQNQHEYELRIFPMAGNQTRKVKITYLIPTEWNKEKVAADLPFSILGTSYNTVDSLSVITWPDDIWKNPAIENNTNISFKEKSDAEFGAYKIAQIPSEFYYNNCKLSFNSPVKNGYFLSEYNISNEGTYQLAFLPSYFLDSVSYQKIAVLVDYDASNTAMSTTDLLTNIRDELLYILNDKDSFNLILSNLSVIRAENNWLPADSLTIVSTFAAQLSSLSNYSNLVPLLNDGINFINNHGNNGKILLITNSDQFGEASIANSLINDLLDLMDPVIPVHIADYQSMNFSYHWIGGSYYYGNEYFYSNLSKLTYATSFDIKDGYTFTELVEMSLQNLGGAIKSFDLYTKPDEGFCYSRYNIGLTANIAYINKPILQTGKFKGTFPFKLEFTGEYNSKIVSEEIIIPESDIVLGDSVAETIWGGAYISSLETQNQTNDIISEIIYNSIEKRILSLYTAFLCLEDTSQECPDCEEEDEIITTNIEISAIENDSIIIVYPNPFDDHVSIKINNLNLNDADQSNIVIFDIKGSQVYSFSKLPLEGKIEYEFSWDGTNTKGEPVQAGIYILMFKSPAITKTIKLVKR